MNPHPRACRQEGASEPQRDVSKTTTTLETYLGNTSTNSFTAESFRERVRCVVNLQETGGGHSKSQTYCVTQSFSIDHPSPSKDNTGEENTGVLWSILGAVCLNYGEQNRSNNSIYVCA